LSKLLLKNKILI